MDVIEELELGISELSQIRDLALDERGNIYVSDEYHHRVLKFSCQGKLLHIFGEGDQSAQSLHYPCGMTIVANRIYIADSWNHRIQVFDLDGSHLGCVGPNIGHCGLNIPVDIKLGHDGLIWVADSDLHRVLCFEQETHEFVRLIQGPGADTPKDMMVRSLGVGLYYLRQIFCSEDQTYLLDNHKITRMGGQAYDDTHLTLVRPGGQILKSTPHGVLLYVPLLGEVMHYNFKNMSISPVFRFKALYQSAWVRMNHLWVIDEKCLCRMELPQWDGSEVPNAPPNDIENRKICSDLVQASSGADVPTLTAQLLETEGELRKHLDGWIEGHAFFQTKGVQPLSKSSLPDNPLNLSLLTQAGRPRALAMESFVTAYGEANYGRILALRSAIAAQEEETRLAAAREVSERFATYFSELLGYQFRVYDHLALGLTHQQHEDCIEHIRHWDGCLFYLARMIKLGFDQLCCFQRALNWMGLSEDLSREGVTGFFIAHCPDHFSSFELHLRNCLSQRDPQRFQMSESARDALHQCRWALEGAVLAQLGQSLETDPVEQERLQGLELGFSLCVQRWQEFRFQGRLHQSFGLGLNLINVLTWSILVEGEGDGRDFLDKVRASKLWTLPSVRKSAALYLVQFQDTSEGLQVLNESVGLYEGWWQASRTPALEAERVIALQYQAFFLAQEGFVAEGLALLERVRDAPDHLHFVANILAISGQFPEAIAACGVDNRANWPQTRTLAQLLLCVGQREECLRLLSNPDSGFPLPHVKLSLAIAHRMVRSFDRALALICELEAELLQTLDYHRGLLYRMMDRDQEALDCFRLQRIRCPFIANAREEVVTLRKLGWLDAYRTTLEALPKAAFLRWDHRRVGPLDPDFSAIIDAYLLFETSPLPDLSSDKVAQQRMYSIVQTQVMAPWIFVHQDTGYLQCQIPWPPGGSK